VNAAKGTCQVGLDETRPGHEGCHRRAIASVMRATRALISTSWTRMMSTPRSMPMAVTAAVPWARWSGGKSSV